MDRNVDEKLSILIISHSSYSDVWPIFFQQLNDNLNYNLDLYLSIDENVNDFKSENINIIVEEFPEKTSWSNRVLNACNKIPNKYVLLLIDDIIFRKPIDIKKLKKLLFIMDRCELKSLKLFYESQFKPQLLIPGLESIGIFPLGSMNRINTHATIWDKFFLTEILREGESIWEFEVNGTFRSNVTFFIAGVTSNFLTYDLGIIKGKWERKTFEFLLEKGYAVYLSKRQTLSRKATIIRFFKLKIYNFIIFKIPTNIRKRIKSVIKKNTY